MFLERHYEESNRITTINVHDTKIIAMVVTGAVAYVLEKRTYKSLCNKRDLIQVNKPYYGYGNSDQALPVMGFCLTTVSLKGTTFRALFIEIQDSHKKLISRKTAVAIVIVTLNLDPDPATDISQNQVTEPINQHSARQCLPQNFQCFSLEN